MCSYVETKSILFLSMHFGVLSCWRRLLASPEPGRVQGDSLGRGLLPVRASLPRWDGATSHHLRLHPDQNAHPAAEGDPGQRREDPPGPSAASSGSEAPQASRNHQGHQPPQGESARAAGAAEESSVHRSPEVARRRRDQGLKRPQRQAGWWVD